MVTLTTLKSDSPVTTGRSRGRVTETVLGTQERTGPLGEQEVKLFTTVVTQSGVRVYGQRISKGSDPVPHITPMTGEPLPKSLYLDVDRPGCSQFVRRLSLFHPNPLETLREGLRHLSLQRRDNYLLRYSVKVLVLLFIRSVIPRPLGGVEGFNKLCRSILSKREREKERG